MPVDFDGRRIHQPHVQRELLSLLQREQDTPPPPPFAAALETEREGRSPAVAGGQVAPGSASAQNIEDGTEDLIVTDAWRATFPKVTTLDQRQNWGIEKLRGYGIEA
jgi:hypothetical protein